MSPISLHAQGVLKKSKLQTSLSWTNLLTAGRTWPCSLFRLFAPQHTEEHARADLKVSDFSSTPRVALASVQAINKALMTKAIFLAFYLFFFFLCKFMFYGLMRPRNSQLRCRVQAKHTQAGCWWKKYRHCLNRYNFTQQNWPQIETVPSLLLLEQENEEKMPSGWIVNGSGSSNVFYLDYRKGKPLL